MKGIKQGKYDYIVDYMINNHCGKIGTIVDERSSSYGVMIDDKNGQFKWYWPKWCCKIIKENTKMKGQIDTVILIREYTVSEFRHELCEKVKEIKEAGLDAEFQYQIGFEDADNNANKKYTVYTCLIIVRKV